MLAVGVLAAVVIHRLQGEGNIRGSSTEEFTPLDGRPEAAAAARRRRGRSTASTRRATARCSSRSGRRSGTIWTFGAGSLVEFPPSIGYGRLYFSTNSGTLRRGQREDGQARVEVPLAPLRRRVAGVGPYKHGTVYAVFLNKPPCNAPHAKGDGQGDRVRRRPREDPLAEDDRAVGELAAPDRQPALRRRLGRRRVGARRAQRRARSGARTSARAGSRAPSRSPAGRLYVGSYDGHVYCLGAQKGRLLWKALGAASAVRARRASTRRPRSRTAACTSARPTARSTRSARRAGKLLWSHVDRRLRLRVARGVERPRLRRLLQQALLRVRRGDRRRALDVQGERRDLGLGDRDRRTSSTSRRSSRPHVRAERAHRQQLWTFPDGKYTPVVAVQGRLFLVGHGKVYGMVPGR